MFFDVDKLHWTRKPLSFSITKDKIEIMKNSFHLLLRQILIAKSDLTNAVSSYI